MSETPSEPRHRKPRNKRGRLAAIVAIVLVLVAGISYAAFDFITQHRAAAEEPAITYTQQSQKGQAGIGVASQTTNTGDYENLHGQIADTKGQDMIRKIVGDIDEASFMKADVQYNTIAVYMKTDAATDAGTADSIAKTVADRVTVDKTELHAPNDTRVRVIVIADTTNGVETKGVCDARL